MQCERHPDTETYVTCVRCGTPICYRCQVQSDVGLLCPTHGRSTPLPQYVISPILYLRAAGAAVLVGVGGGLLMAFLAPDLAFIPFLRILVLGGLGYLVGQAVSRAARGRRGRGLQVIAGGGVVLAVVVGLGGALFTFFGLIGSAIAVVVAVGRLR